MKIKLPVKWLMMVIMIVIAGKLAFSANPLQSETLIKVPVKLNNVMLKDSLVLREISGGTQVEVRKFMSLIGGSFHPFSRIFHQNGLMVQYGKLISFSGLENPLGFVNCKMVPVIPPVSLVQKDNSLVYFAPLSFLAYAIGGTVIYNPTVQRIDITVGAPSVFGSVFPPAANVAAALDNSGYTVQQAEISRMNPIEFCLAHVTPNANGNNAAFPYLGIQIPPSPGRDSIYYVPITFTLNEDEAVVMIGKTPPKCKYFSYRSYLMNRFYEFPPQTTRTKINASLGESISLYRMREDLPLDSMFNRKFALIMAADSLIAKHIKNTILTATPAISAKDIYFDIIPNEFFKFGNKPQGDWGSFLHRVVLFKNIEEEERYMNNTPLEIMRLTPKQPSTRVFFKTPGFLPRASGINEFHLMPALNLLERGIYNAYHKTHEIIWIKEYPGTMEAYTAIQEGEDALGDTHDALYIFTSDFQFREDDIVLVYGVNHTLTGQAVYNNISIYGSKYLNGFCGVTNFEMEKSARPFVTDTVIADKLFAYSLARHPMPGNPFSYVVPSDTFKMLAGINVNDSAFLISRLYVNSITKIGPDPLEVILDRTIILRPLATGISGFRIEREGPVMKIFPNPVKDKAILEFTIPEWSDVSLALYNLSGQQLGKMQRFSHVRGTVLQDIQLAGNLPSGEYLLRGIVNEKETAEQHTVTSKILFVGGRGF